MTSNAPVPRQVWDTVQSVAGQTLMLNLILAPAVLVGVLACRWLLERIPQRLFEHMLLVFAAVAALRLIGAF